MIRQISGSARIWMLAACAAALALPIASPAQVPGSQTKLGMGIDQKLGATIPKDVPFKDETGRDIKFGDLLKGRPVVLIPIFYNCQTGCFLITQGLLKTIAKANQSNELVVGKDFDLVMLSIHPKETPELARDKKSEMIATLGRPDAAPSWHLLTGTLPNIHRVTDAIGFTYKYDPVKNLINHPTCSVILSPEGKISAYTIGNEFPTKVLLRDLDLARTNQVGEKADQSFMFGCIMVDPATGKTTVVVERVVQLGCIATLIVLPLWIGLMSLNNRRKALRQGGPLGSG